MTSGIKLYDFIPVIILICVCYFMYRHTLTSFYERNSIIHNVQNPELEQYIMSFSKKDKDALQSFMESISVYYKHEDNIHKLWNMTIKSIIGKDKIAKSPYSDFTFKTLFSGDAECKLNNVQAIRNVEVEMIHSIIERMYNNTMCMFSTRTSHNADIDLGVLYTYATDHHLSDDKLSHVSLFLKDLYVYYNTKMHDNGIMGFHSKNKDNTYDISSKHVTSVLGLNSASSTLHAYQNFKQDELAYHAIYRMIQSGVTNGLKPTPTSYLHDKEDLIIIIRMYINKVFTHLVHTRLDEGKNKL